MQNQHPNNYLISYHTLRQLIGILGMALPFICWGVNSFVNKTNLLNNHWFIHSSFSHAYLPGNNLKSSISHFYYTASGPAFVGILVTVAVFLFTYKGHPLKKQHDKFYWLTDKLLTRSAAICALGIVIFPTSSQTAITDNIYIFVASHTAGIIHLSFAALFFIIIALLSIINFRRAPNKNFIKNAEGNTYLFCGWGILVCITILAIYSFTALANVNWLPYYFIYLVETIMLTLFGIAWLVKGKSLPTQYILNRIQA
jgi:hypothetical protein